MKFGYVPDDSILDRIDFRLPPDDAGNASILFNGKKRSTPTVYVGCAEYHVKEWKGLLYPQRAKETEMLSLYAAQFQMLEMNGTHYRIYPPEQIKKWAEATDPGAFVFVPKFPKFISHENHSFEELQELTAGFMDGVQAFGTKLGPLFLQMSESFSPENRRGFFAYLASLPEGFSYFVELRHPDWFIHPAMRQELLSALRTLGIGLVITDTPGHRETCHMALSIPKVMIRFVGRHRHPSTTERIHDWTQRLKFWLDAGLEEAYFIAHTGLSSLLTAVQVIPEFNAKLGTEIPLPKLLSHALPAGGTGELGF
jgi:uncharacterized protein YecE (DUF72 family)